MSQRHLPRPHESRRARQRRRAEQRSRKGGVLPFEPFGCQRNPNCVAGFHHADEDCVVAGRWDGMPDPNRHNPFGVAVVLACISIAWLLVIGVVLALIFGWRP